jgi:glycosyltransferase involved in cell wall biosynthesis
LTFLSIITPTFNSEKYIEQCIRNVIDQQCSKIEHIIVDGGSTDKTVDIIKHYASIYPHIRWLSEQDNGQSDAMNKGIQMAQGTYIGFLNADDDYVAGALERVLSIISDQKKPFVCSNCNVWDENNELLFVSKPKDNNFFACYFRQSFPINPSSYFYKKSVHQTVGLYDINDHLTMDLDFFLRYMNHYKSYTYFDEIWGNFRVLESTKTFQDREKGMMFTRKKQKFDLYWKKNPLFIRYFYILKNKVIHFSK